MSQQIARSEDFFSAAFTTTEPRGASVDFLWMETYCCHMAKDSSFYDWGIYTALCSHFSIMGRMLHQSI